MAKPDLAFVVDGSDDQLQLWRKALLQSESIYFRIPFAIFERVTFDQRIG